MKVKTTVKAGSVSVVGGGATGFAPILGFGGAPTVECSPTKIHIVCPPVTGVGP
jgi:hypothetical protein